MKQRAYRSPVAVRWIGIVSALAFIVAGAASVLPVAYGSSQAGPSVFEVPATTKSFADVVEMVSPAVVAISISKQAAALPASAFPRHGGQGSPFDDFFDRFFDAPGMAPPNSSPVQALGSGFLVEKSGYIVTNNHVVDGADSIRVLFQDGRELEASLVGTDPKTDLALLKVETQDSLPALAFGDSDHARVGDWVLAIGNPFGLGGSATAGIISARGRDIRSGPYDDYLQIDAPINSGNSGGPVFNADGEVIGVNTAIYSPNGGNVGIGFAIPSKQVQTIVAELKTSGVVHRGWLGVQIQDIDTALAASLGLDESTGALIADVIADSPAAKSDLQIGDVIMQFGADKIASAKALSIAVANTDPAIKVPVKILRDGKNKTIQVKLGESELATANVSGGTGKSNAVGGDLGLGLSNLTDNERQQLGLPNDYPGVIIRKVDPSSSAASQGLRPGDVISRVGSTTVHNVAEASAAIGKAKKTGKSAALLVRRRDGQQYVSVAFS